MPRNWTISCGAVVTNAADRIAPRLAALVFLDGYTAVGGASILNADPPERRKSILAGTWKNAGRLGYISRMRFPPSDFRDMAARLASDTRFICFSIEAQATIRRSMPEAPAALLVPFAG